MKRPTTTDPVARALNAIAFLLAMHLALGINEAVYRMCHP